MRVGNNFKNGYLFLSSRIFSSLIIIIQLTLSFILFYEGFSIWYKSYEHIEKTNRLIGNKSIYNLNNISDIDYLTSHTFKEKDVVNRMDEFEKFLNNNDKFKIYREKIECLSIKNKNNIDSIKNKEMPVFKDGYDTINAITVDENFLNTFNYNLSSGNLLHKEDFKNSETLNVLLGDDYKEYYKIGDIIEAYACNSLENPSINLKVKGFIKKGELYINSRFNPNSIETMDNKIIFPRFPINKDNKNYRTSLYDGHLMTNVVSDLSKEEISKMINNKAKALKLYDIEVLSKDGELEFYKEMNSRVLSVIFIIGALVILFTSINIITSLTDYIMKNKKIFAVNLMCGSTKGDIIQSIYFTISLFISISLVLSSIFYRLVFNSSMEFKSLNFFVLIIFSIILSLVLVIVPYLKIKKDSLIEILKNE